MILYAKKHLKNPKQFSTIINFIEPKKRKSELLPLQGTLWEKYAQLQKDQHREVVSLHLLDDFIADKQKEQKNVCRQQYELLKNKCNFIKIIYKNLNDSETVQEMKFVATWVKLMIDNSCQEILPGMRDNVFRQKK